MHFTNLNPDCGSRGVPVLRIVNPPEHGTAETAQGDDYPGYPKENIRVKCNQHKVGGTQIKYKSADKYTGKDTMDLLVLFPESGVAWEIHYEIDVR
jgi:hypothetical protein